MANIDVTVAIASINTAWATELCLRSLAAHDAGVPYRLVVGDCGSTDGSLPMLTRRVKAGLIDELEVEAAGRRHAAWVDHWVDTCPTRWLLMLDSDVEIRARGWIRDMLSRAKSSQAVLCTAHIEPEQPDYKNPFTGEPLRLGERPAMHCLLLDVAEVRQLGRSFLSADAADPRGGRPLHYDVGGWVMAGARDRAVAMPAQWEATTLTHFRALSWGKNMGGERRTHYIRTQPVVFGRLLVYRATGVRGGAALRLLSILKGRTRRQ